MINLNILLTNPLLNIILLIIVGYLIGCINPAYLLGLLKGFDIRTMGSGNAGASNALITMGKKAGVACAIFDIFKGIIAVKLGETLGDDWAFAGILTGGACILGHMYPVYMKFRGGKGLATLGGVVLTQDWRIILGLVVIEIVLLLITDYICVVPMTGSALFTLALWQHMGPISAICMLPATFAILIKHTENIRKIKYGIEAKFSMLWRKEEEKQRIYNNWMMLPDDVKKNYVDIATGA